MKIKFECKEAVKIVVWREKMEEQQLIPLAEPQPDNRLVEKGLNRKQRRAEAARKRAIRGKTLPDRVSVNRSSPYYYRYCNYIGVRFDGQEQSKVVECCVSEGWVQCYVETEEGIQIERDQYVLGPRWYGKVELYWRD